MEQQNEEKIMEFYDACTELQNAKLILADAKIGKILKCVTSSGELFAAVGQCLVNFNFESEFRKAQVQKDSASLYFALPNDRSKLVALVFSILSACDTHQLDLHSFIKDFFTNDSDDMSYGFLNFVHKVVFPFRDVLCAMVGVGEIGAVQEETECDDEECEVCQDDENEENEYDVVGSFFADVTTILTRIKEVVKDDLKTKQDRKEEIFITIDALFQAIEFGSLKMMNALVISLYYLLKPVKSVRFYKTELEERFAKFYGQLED